MALFANKILVLLLVIFASTQQQIACHDRLDNEGSASQTKYRFVNVPVADIKYRAPIENDFNSNFKFSPSYKIPSTFRSFPAKTKIPTVFYPEPKYVSYINYLLASKNIKSKYSSPHKKLQSIYKPVRANFHAELPNGRLPLLQNEKQSADNEYITNPDPREFKANFSLQDVPNLYSLQKEFLNSASQKQIEAFYEDQQKKIDEQLELQLLNDPNPAAKGKYNQFLKAKEDEKIEKEYVEDLQKKGQYRGTSYSPVKIEERQILRKLITPGLSHFRTSVSVPGSYAFEVTL